MKSEFLSRPGRPNTMLIVDDDEGNLELLSSIFEDQHITMTAENGQTGFDALQAHGKDICAILLDVQMPIMDGLEFLHRISRQQIQSRIPVFLITGETDYKIINRAYELGVMDVISKPILPTIVEKRVHSVMELFAARNYFQEMVAEKTEELREKNIELNHVNERLTHSLETENELNYRLTQALANEKEYNQGMIEALATATEFKSSESGDHVRRIYGITQIFLTKSPLRDQYTEEEISQISNASILHDVGKISVPDEVLNKKGRLDNDEFAVMKLHTVSGEKLLTQIPQLKKMPFYEYACRIARHHHERWDGKGYPDGLRGEEIPMCAQIVSLADVYDALVSPRIYKPPFTHEQSMHMILDGKCGTFNPKLLEYFVEVADDIRALYCGNNNNQQ